MKPILLNTEMVKAVLDGRKTQTRRLVKRLKLHSDYGDPQWDRAWTDGGDNEQYLHVPYSGNNIEETTHRHYAPCQVGDVLYVRETWRVGAWDFEGQICVDYKTGPRKRWVQIYGDDDDYDNDKFNELCIQCSDEAEEAGCEYDNEGLYEWEPGESPCRWRPSIHMPKTLARIFLEVTGVRCERVQEIIAKDCLLEGIVAERPLEAICKFKKLWNSLYPGSWDRSDWVWVIEFKRVDKPEGNND